MRPNNSINRALAALVLLLAPAMMAIGEEKKKPSFSTWTDPVLAATEDPDFTIQGEYRDDKNGVQLVARGGGKFEAWWTDAGLPGAGAKGDRIRLAGELKDNQLVLKSEDSSTTAKLNDDKLEIQLPGKEPAILERVERSSPTLGAKPPPGAVVLFDGTSADAWDKGKMENNHLLASGIFSNEKFKSYTFHLEFRTPYMPSALGQKRGNSGVYHWGRWETQILDSFGLEPKDNECGGIYSVAKPALNMCLPPLAWQTYDVEFTAPEFDKDGVRTAWPRITVKLNGVLVHEDLELKKDFTAAAPMNKPLDQPAGPVFLQDHGNLVVFRNIWLLPKE
ncbi:MAG: DUF1080 domain-containing protein [Verrucomicrobiales bacterium]